MGRNPDIKTVYLIAGNSEIGKLIMTENQSFFSKCRIEL